MNELKALEENRTLIHAFTSGNALIEYNKNEEIIRKSLQAFEIIKNKKVDVWLFNNNDNFNDYNWDLYLCFHREDSEKCSLTQEEYDLLKEVLSDGQ